MRRPSGGAIRPRAFQRFRALPAAEIAAAIDMAIGAHVGLCGRGWVACDFYDGSMMYDFAARRLSMFDLDSYSRGPFTNEMGRLFGSERFMAPEEFVKGAQIDERTTVFNLGRAAAVFLSDGTLERAAFRGTDAQHAAMIAACRPAPDDRLATGRRAGRDLAGLNASRVRHRLPQQLLQAELTGRSITRWMRSVVPRLATRCGSERRRYQASPGAMSTRRRFTSKTTSGLVVMGTWMRAMPSSAARSPSACSLIVEPGASRISRVARGSGPKAKATSRKYRQGAMNGVSSNSVAAGSL